MEFTIEILFFSSHRMMKSRCEYGKHTMQELYQWQALPLNIKVRMTAERIRNWVNEFGEDGVYLSFSGGKDSTVLGHIIREVCGYKIFLLCS